MRFYMTGEIVNTITYEIDKYDVIRAIEGSWQQFLDENDTPRLGADTVVGVSLWDFISSTDVQSLYRKALKHVRSSGRSLSFPFRCDSPGTIRQMRMEIVPGDEGSVRFTTTPVEIRPRDKDTWYNYVAFGRSCRFFSCSVCNKVKHQDVWLPLEDALAQACILDDDKPFSLYGALCPGCLQSIDSLIGS